MAHDHTLMGWMTGIQQQLETTLQVLLPPEHTAPQALHQAMRYAALEGGKRVRPLLVCAAGELVDAPREHLLRIGAAIEMIHAYSLVHDDMPCMDNDVLRRGKATCHVAFGEANALLVGDALQTQAFDLLSRPLTGVEAATQLTMVNRLALASGHAGMAGGQAIDLASVGLSLSQPELEYMHMLKTGALIRVSVQLGAMAGRPLPAADMDHLDHFAKCMGLAFQVVDDVLDCEADTATLGKTAGKDAEQDKPTYVSLMGFSQAKHFAFELREQAFAALDKLSVPALRLKDLANYIVDRSF
jgi:farnesyl diphosphate synthase